MKLVYVIASALDGQSQESRLAAAILAGYRVRAMADNLAPVVPHVAILPDSPSCPPEVSRKAQLQERMALMCACDAAYVHHEEAPSRSARLERRLAIQKGLPVFYELHTLAAWARVPQ